MKKKQIFSLGLYKEGLRRVRIPGIIFLVLLTVSAILVPLSTVIQKMSYVNSLEESGYDIPNNIIESVRAIDVHTFLILTIFVVAPVLAWTLFSFLNKRNSSDFYHSLPHTRLCIFTSTIAAFASWIAGIIVISTAVSRITIALFPQYLSLVSDTYIPFMIGCFTASLLSGAVTILAMTITGTVLNNIIVGGLITFLPRFVIYFVSSAVSVKFPLIADNYTYGFLSLDINIITGIFDYLFTSADLSLVSTIPQIYTFCLSIIYFALATFFFCRRKSESAERAAPSRTVQAAFRTVISMVVCIPVCYNIFVGNISSASDIFTAFSIYVIAVLVYFSYELITTRKWKNLLRSLPGLLVVALLNVALIGAMYGIYRAEVSFTPDADDVDYISIVTEQRRIFDFKAYALNATSDIEITDEDAIKIVTDALKKNTDNYLERGNFYKYNSSMYSYEDKASVRYTYCTVKIKAGLTTKYRRLYLDNAQYETVSKALSTTEEYAKVWLRLPEAQRGTITIGYGNYNYTKEDAENLFDTIKKEVSQANFNDWYTFLYNYDYNRLGEISYISNNKRIEVPFAPNILPETSKAYIEILSGCSTVSEEELYNHCMGEKPIEQYEVDIVTIQFIDFDENGNCQLNYIPLNSSDTANKVFENCFIKGEELDIQKDFFTVEFITGVVKDKETNIYHYFRNTVSFPATEDAYDWLYDNNLIK